MRHNLKLIFWILILTGVFFLLAKFFDFGREPIPASDPSLLKSVAAGGSGNQFDDIFVPESGRLIEDFLPGIPTDFPKDMPIDQNPIQVLKSYSERMVRGNTDEGELFHNQNTYAYVTRQDANSIADAFEKYLKENDFDVSKNSGYSFLTVYGERKDIFTTIGVNIYTQNQFEQLVTISVLNSEQIPQP